MKNVLKTRLEGSLNEPNMADLIEANKQRMELNKELYRKRQAMVEHPFGIFKRQWDFYYIMTKKTIKRASADVGLIFTAYNIRRIINILGQDVLKKYLSAIAFLFLMITRYFKGLYALLFQTTEVKIPKILCSIMLKSAIFMPKSVRFKIRFGFLDGLTLAGIVKKNLLT